jgi:hypothetical protein
MTCTGNRDFSIDLKLVLNAKPKQGIFGNDPLANYQQSQHPATHPETLRKTHQ